MNDHCLFTFLPESVSLEELNPNHYADIDGDGYFESVEPKTKLILEDRISFDETFGCSCKEILDMKPGEDLGEIQAGCTEHTIDKWKNQRGWAK